MINIENVTKRYGKKNIAVNNVTMHVKPGELSVLLGPNGAGKSTLIKSICGLLRFDGKISISGKSNRSISAKRKLGYIPEMPAMYNMLTVKEHLQFIAKAYQLQKWEKWGNQLLDRFELSDKRNKLGQELSKGMQQKVSICTALLPHPTAVVFDEPFVGLDPHAIRQLKELLQEMKNDGAALIISTHMIESMEAGWDTTYIMGKGEIMETRRRVDVNNGESLEDLYFRITEKAVGTAAQPTTTGNDAKASTTSDAAQATTASDAAQTTTASDAAQATTTSDAAQTTTASDAAQATTTSDAAQATTASDAAQAATTSDAAQTTTASDAAQAATTSADAQAATTSADAQTKETSNDAQTATTTTPDAQASNTPPYAPKNNEVDE